MQYGNQSILKIRLHDDTVINPSIHPFIHSLPLIWGQVLVCSRFSSWTFPEHLQRKALSDARTTSAGLFRCKGKLVLLQVSSFMSKFISPFISAISFFRSLHKGHDHRLRLDHRWTGKSRALPQLSLLNKLGTTSTILLTLHPAQMVSQVGTRI